MLKGFDYYVLRLYFFIPTFKSCSVVHNNTMAPLTATKYHQLMLLIAGSVTSILSIVLIASAFMVKKNLGDNVRPWLSDNIVEGCQYWAGIPVSTILVVDIG